MNDKNNWEELFDRHLRGELDEAAKERLAELLDSDPISRREFVEQAQWDTEITEALSGTTPTSCAEDAFVATQTKTNRKWLSKPTVLRTLLSAAVAIIVVLSASLVYQVLHRTPSLIDTEAPTQQPANDIFIARITGLSGALIWTGDRGQTVRNIQIGTQLAGGTIEGLAPDSWFELRFHDGSTVTISGTSILTFADPGQKQLRLREGRLSANVAPQPAGNPMLIRTRSALLEVVGTQFEVEANLASTSLNVSEGKVRLRRLSDGSEVDVTAKHHVNTDTDDQLLPILVPDSIHRWKSQLHRKPGNYGKWQPATELQQASLKAIPLIPPDSPNVTLYLAGLSVHRPDGSPVVLLPGSKFVVRGRLHSPARVHFGIRVMQTNGDFAGMFRGDLNQQQPVATTNSNGHFEEVYELPNFTIDPAVLDRKDEVAARPDGLILNGVWAFTHTDGLSGLEITEVELIPPSQAK